MILLVLAGCPKPIPVDEAPPPLDAPEAAPAVPEAGALVEGTYTDEDLPFTLPVPEGWEARIGAREDGLRVSLSDPETGTEVEVWTFKGGGTEPRRRGECAWTFSDSGRYRAPRVAADITVATCTPDDPDRPRVLAWILVHDDITYEIDAIIPEGALGAGRAKAEGVVGSVRFR